MSLPVGMSFIAHTRIYSATRQFVFEPGDLIEPDEDLPVPDCEELFDRLAIGAYAPGALPDGYRDPFFTEE